MPYLVARDASNCTSTVNGTTNGTSYGNSNGTATTGSCNTSSPPVWLAFCAVLVIPAIYLAFLGVPILLAWFLRGLACCFGGTYREGRYRTQRLLDLDERGKRAQSFFWCWGRCCPCLFLRKRVAREEKEREWDGRLVDGEDGMESIRDVEPINLEKMEARAVISG